MLTKSIALSWGFRKLVFVPTTAGFQKWCLEVRRSKFFLKNYPNMSEENRERCASEYAERKLFFKRYLGFESQLDEAESPYLKNCLSGKSLDLRDKKAEQLFVLWKEQQRFLIQGARNRMVSISLGDVLKDMRISSGMTKTELAFFAGISLKTYMAYERNLRQPRIEIILILFAVMGFQYNNQFLRKP